MRLGVGSRVFTLEDQLRFANASGDWNPIHVDPVYARRCLTGQAVVHGTHVVMWALDAMACNRNVRAAISELNLQFHEPIFLEQTVDCYLIESQAENALLEVYCANKLSISIRVTAPTGHARRAPVWEASAQTAKRLPMARTADEIAHLSGRWSVDASVHALAVMYPHLHEFLGETIAPMLAHASRLVGMECPGLHSLFSEIELKASHSKTVALADFGYKVVSLDKRFGLVRAEVEGLGFAGVVTTFIRPPPRRQASFGDIALQVSARAFAGQRALVVGGSRGLGEIVAKLLAAGGADVCLTFHQGQLEASSVVGEIRAHGGLASCVPLDVTASFDPHWSAPQGWRPTHLYYFATPFIFSGRRGEFSSELMARLTKSYVSGFAEIVGILAAEGLKGVFYPSTIALDEMPTDMAEYCAAKAAGEMLCQILQKRHASIAFSYERLPRLATDQTASLIPVKNADPLPVMRNILLKMSAQKSDGVARSES